MSERVILTSTVGERAELRKIYADDVSCNGASYSDGSTTMLRFLDDIDTLIKQNADLQAKLEETEHRLSVATHAMQDWSSRNQVLRGQNRDKNAELQRLRTENAALERDALAFRYMRDKRWHCIATSDALKAVDASGSQEAQKK